MKNRYKVIGMCCLIMQLFGLSACIDDTGNYDYMAEDDLLPVTIKPLDESYEAFQGDSLVIIPEFECMDDETRYQYKWYVLQSESRELTVLSEEKDFRKIIPLPQKEYILYFEVKDPELNVYRRATSKLFVTANIQNGWYVLKGIDGMTDFDYMGVDSSRVDNVMKMIVGDARLQGDPLKIMYHPKSYYTESVDEEGNTVILRNQKAIHLISDRDFKTIDAATLQLFKNYEDEFYSFPAGAFPCDINYQKEYLFYLDAGKLYTCYIGGVGKFGMPKNKDAKFDYDLHPQMISNRDMALVFDRKSKTFFKGTNSNEGLSYYRDETGNSLWNSLNAEVVTMLQKSSPEDYSGTGYVILKDYSKSSGTEYALLSMSISTYSTSYPVSAWNTIPQGCYLPYSTVWGAHKNSDCIYFAKGGNVLGVYVNATGLDEREEFFEIRDNDEVADEDGEEIVFIQNIEGRFAGDKEKANYLVVAMNHAKGYKVYFFTIVGKTPEFDIKPKYVLKGEGKAKYVMYYNSSN